MNNKKIKKFDAFLESRLDEDISTMLGNIATSGISKILKNLEENPTDFIETLSKILKDQGDLPSHLKGAFNDTAEEQVEAMGGFQDSTLSIANDGDKVEATFNKKNSEEKEIEEKIAKVEVGTSKITKPDFNKLGAYKFNSSSWSKYDRKDYMELLEDKGLINKINLNSWNLLGLRNDIDKRKEVPNGFIDAMVLLPPKNSGKSPEIFECTTFPGMGFRVAPYRAWWISRRYKYLGASPANKGVAIMQPGIYEYEVSYSDKLGKIMRPREGAKVQRYSIVKTPSEAVRFYTYSPGKGESGNKSILIHSANGSEKINTWSAGCQVVKKSSDLDKIMKTVSAEEEGRIKYVLINI